MGWDLNVVSKIYHNILKLFCKFSTPCWEESFEAISNTFASIMHNFIFNDIAHKAIKHPRPGLKSNNSIMLEIPKTNLISYGNRAFCKLLQNNGMT